MSRGGMVSSFKCLGIVCRAQVPNRPLQRRPFKGWLTNKSRCLYRSRYDHHHHQYKHQKKMCNSINSTQKAFWCEEGYSDHWLLNHDAGQGHNCHVWIPIVLFCKTCLRGCLCWHARCGILTHEYVNGIKTSYRRGERVRTFFKRRLENKLFNLENIKDVLMATCNIY